MFPNLSHNICEAILEERFWDLKSVNSECDALNSPIIEEVAHERIEEENHPLIQFLANKYQNIEPNVIALGLRKSLFEADVAEMYFQETFLLSALRTELQESISAPVESEFAIYREELVEPQIQTDQSVDHVVMLDIHRFTWEKALNLVRNTVKMLKGKVEKVNFITGRGRASQNEVPLLRLFVLKILEKEGIRCWVLPTNPGIIQAFLQ
jgi:hypothetical protein